MKTIAVVFIICSLLCASCDTTAVFESPNYVRRYPAVLHLLNGRSFEGRLSVEPGRPLAADVELFEEGERRPMRFRLDEVKGYTAKGRYYELKERKGGLSLGRNFSFMSRLTPDSSRIQLYADQVKRRPSFGGGRSLFSIWETDLYLRFAGENDLEVYPLNGTRFAPDFHEKMSSLLQGCPTLSAKIKDRQEGYRLSAYNHTAVLLRIINEYNQCGGQAK